MGAWKPHAQSKAAAPVTTLAAGATRTMNGGGEMAIHSLRDVAAVRPLDEPHARSMAVKTRCMATGTARCTTCGGAVTAIPPKADDHPFGTPSRSASWTAAGGNRGSGICARCTTHDGRHMVIRARQRRTTETLASGTSHHAVTSRCGAPTIRIPSGGGCGSIASSWRNISSGRCSPMRRCIIETAAGTTTGSRTWSCGHRDIREGSGSTTWLSSRSRRSGGIGRICCADNRGGPS
jgi:hypothetical protein